MILFSVPLAFLGGRFKISADVFFVILGFSLMIASILMLSSKRIEKKKLPIYSNSVIRGGIGFLSGLVGIGGGIFLSPVLHLSRWHTPKVIAATTAVFILVNSMAGLLGQISTHGFSLNGKELLLLMAAVLAGGQLGSRTAIYKISAVTVKRITGVLILLVSLRILFKYLLA